MCHACAAVPTRPPVAEPGALISGVVTDHTASAQQGRDSNPDLSCLSRLVFSCFVVEFAQRIMELVSVLLPLPRARLAARHGQKGHHARLLLTSVTLLTASDILPASNECLLIASTSFALTSSKHPQRSSLP